MSEELADMVAELSAKCTAYELVLIDLVFSTWPLEVHRNERRDNVCRALEQGMANADPNSHSYLFLQRALATIEGLYDTPGPPSGAGPI
ncbi:hypothetical protein HNO88_002985 [Novosphingobium chloroacetimidivorans]|uniref:Uncharacterized protein n=1 Tax=Novosphingobium chloroacetimidivorans TaxID=1428314 RepID=A0A7W7NWS5_9SPHN|nr:hypothetical protein [Novosphingobium chloroacetimidivorans]MBB4859656.1 hypothetical protein [Novosphingobium chloroacetimidivorans]